MTVITRPEMIDHDIEQHRLSWSILLHLVPGAALTVFVLVMAPLAAGWGLPAIFMLFAGILLVITPIELGILLAHTKRTTGSFNLRHILPYRARLPKRRLVPLVVGLVAWFALWLILTTTFFDQWIAERAFAWLPDTILQFSMIDEAGTDTSIRLAAVMAVVAVIGNGFVGPVVEELYFRGFLLPRIARLGRGAPVLNTVLFSMYHFWTPWQNPARIIGFLPITWKVWKHRSIEIGIAAHVAMNLVFLAGLLAFVVSGASS